MNTNTLPRKSLEDRLSPHRVSPAWQTRGNEHGLKQSEPIFRVMVDNEWVLLPIYSFLSGTYAVAQQLVQLNFQGVSIQIVGPKVADFVTAFCSNTATLLKVDGTDITSVTTIVNSP